MSFLQALVYFVREAASNMARSARINFLAIVTIAVSLFVGGLFLLLSTNLALQVESWRQDALVIVYLEPAADREEVAELGRLAAAGPWTLAVREVTPRQAAERFGDLFPELADLPASEGASPLPGSLEITYDQAAVESAAFEAWLARLESAAGSSAVDDDRDWLRQVEVILRLVRIVGWSLGGVLLVAAVLTAASVIRLTAFIHRDEISVMRLVGATEFFIRGPFYTEGLLQGLLGALVAVGGLLAVFLTLGGAEGSLIGSVLLSSFIGWRQVLLLLVTGSLAGLAGALLSLRREIAGLQRKSPPLD